ncbi:DUF805 domain-containing protein [Haemophilus haemoglobinophilus]|nr:DUF805 domain-containing protein [Canicola haemoglobinophilus]
MNIFHNYLFCWKNSVNYKGRARRSEFAGFFLLNLCLILLLYLFDHYVLDPLLHGFTFINLSINLHFSTGTLIFPPKDSYTSFYFLLFSFFPLIAVTTRRYHDLDKSGWWQIIFCPLFPISIILTLLISHILFICLMIIYLLMLSYQFLKLLFQEGEYEANRFGENPKLNPKTN